MPNRDGSPTRAERTVARQAAFHQQRVADVATRVDAIHVGCAYLTAVIKQMEAVDPQKADEITVEVTDYLLRQANAHAMHASKGVKR